MYDISKARGGELATNAAAIFGSSIVSLEAAAIEQARLAELAFKELSVGAAELDNATRGLRGTRIEAVVKYCFAGYGSDSINYYPIKPSADRMRINGAFAGITVLKESMVESVSMSRLLHERSAELPLDFPVVCAKLDGRPQTTLEGDRLEFNDHVPNTLSVAWVPLREVEM